MLIRILAQVDCQKVENNKIDGNWKVYRKYYWISRATVAFYTHHYTCCDDPHCDRNTCLSQNKVNFMIPIPI